jgi:glycosyltransferase involved in cell wall biosynthesis
VAVKVLDLDLGRPIEPVWGLEAYEGLRLLVRRHGQPIGWAYLATSGQPMVSSRQIQDTILAQLGWTLVGLALAPPPCDTAHAVPPLAVSVVVCTRDRADQLERCLDAVLALDHPGFEVMVVDNASTTDATARLAARLPVRYVREDRPGLDWARNRGIAEAAHSIIAFTDDDARPDPGWLGAITAAFQDPDVSAVTGAVFGAELETDAQLLFELEYNGMVQSVHPRTIRRESLKTRELLWASSFGVGANMAFRREALRAVGGFDVALDVGTPSGGGGDIEMFHRLVARGGTIVYEPRAVVWHTHRRSRAMLRRQLRDNGRGFGAYLLTCARNRTVPRATLLRFALTSWIGWWLLRRLVRPDRLGRRLVATELAGALASPLAYLRARRQARRIATASAARATPVRELDVQPLKSSIP